jgi:hypothetical protein
MQQRKAEWSILLTTLPILEVFFLLKKKSNMLKAHLLNKDEYKRT